MGAVPIPYSDPRAGGGHLSTGDEGKTAEIASRPSPAPEKVE
jgi:hypothetical protein